MVFWPGFNDENGAVVWQLEIPQAIDDMCLHQDKLYIAIYDQIQVIDPQYQRFLKIIRFYAQCDPGDVHT